MCCRCFLPHAAKAAISDVLVHAQALAPAIRHDGDEDAGPTMSAEQLLRVSAATAFLPSDDLWVHMTFARKRQAIAEIVEFALMGT